MLQKASPMTPPKASDQRAGQIDPRLLATWDNAAHLWRIAPGAYQVMLAASARDIKQTVTVQVAARTLPVGWSTAK